MTIAENKPDDAKDGQEDTRISLPLEAFKTALPYIVSFLLIAMLGYWLVDPAPPKKIVISISKYDGNFQAYAQLYGALLKEDGVGLEIRESESQIDSLRELRKPGTTVDMTFMQGGVANAEPGVGVVSLGSLYYEPLWIFCKNQHKIRHLSGLKGKRIAIGRAGSGTNILTHLLLNEAGITAQNSKLLEIDDEATEEAFRHNEVDVAFISGVPTLPLIQEMASLPNVDIADLDDAEAFSRNFTFLHHLVLPEGALNLKRNVPSHEVNLLVPTISLVARDSMHPALVYLMLKVISRVHGGAGMLQHGHEFPADKDTDFELSSQAKKFYESGPPFFDRYLPFWVATFFNRVLIILLPLLALAIPLSRIAPAIYIWLLKSRIYKLYGELRFLELQLHAPQPLDRSVFRKELDAIEHRVNNLRMPVSFASHLYELRSHIELVRSRLR